MDFSGRHVALAVLFVGIAMMGISWWLERRRQYHLMPSLIPPVPLLLLGGSLALIALVAYILIPESSSWGSDAFAWWAF